MGVILISPLPAMHCRPPLFPSSTKKWGVRALLTPCCSYPPFPGGNPISHWLCIFLDHFLKMYLHIHIWQEVLTMCTDGTAPQALVWSLLFFTLQSAGKPLCISAWRSASFFFSCTIFHTRAVPWVISSSLCPFLVNYHVSLHRSLGSFTMSLFPGLGPGLGAGGGSNGLSC